jgi:hypothetical protein
MKNLFKAIGGLLCIALLPVALVIYVLYLLVKNA